jgi:LmbE family N-acetylglucosaminyl deacetylase
MEFSRSNVDIYVHKAFRKKSLEEVLAKTTHLAIGAHQDDIELMAYHGIQECYKSKGNWFTGVTLTDGRGSPRELKALTDRKMILIRLKEQQRAAELGQYLAQFQLGYTSDEVRMNAVGICDDLENILIACKPEYVYLHNLADKHFTHVASSVRSIAALRRLREVWMPQKVFGCEVWRDLDWMVDSEKVPLSVSKYPDLRMKLIRVFKSQIQGAKRYDLGMEGRRRANATFFESSKVDKDTHLSFAMDLTPLVQNVSLDPREFVRKKLDGMKTEMLSSIERFL